MSDVPPSAPVHLENTFGPILVGTLVGNILYGITLLQTYRYFRLYSADNWYLKGTVITLFLLDTSHAIATSHVCYYYLISNHSDSALLDGVNVWSTRIVILAHGGVVIISQLFYVRRLLLLNNRYKILAIITGILIFAELGFTINYIVVARDKIIDVTTPAWQKFDVAALAIILVVDFALATTLVLFLRRGHTGIKRGDSILDILAVYTINTCVLSTVMNGLILVFVPHASVTDLQYLGAAIPSVRTYTSSVLAVLNCRRSLAELASETSELGTFGLGAVQPPSVNTPVQETSSEHIIHLRGRSSQHSGKSVQGEPVEGRERSFQEDNSTEF